VPFHASANVNRAPELFPSCPTAVQAVAELHDTPSKEPLVVPLGLRVVWTAQVAPFHVSTRVTTLDMVANHPTAVQAVADLHETAVR
jgi:hypothetical protein